jgi:predicted pyridoxine 5'-phosphate oxidase superfamily flavin-nucleotide-binding protein
VTCERLNGLAWAIIDSNRYMALGTADPDGHPWVSPIWYASATGTGWGWWLMWPSTGPVRL